MQSHSLARFLAVAAVCGAPLSLLGNGLRLVSQDAFASARGEAFVATADNPSAVYYNPAGLIQLEGTQVRGGIYGLYYDPTYTPPASAANGGNTYHLENNLAAALQFYLSQKLGDWPVSVGVGMYAPYGGDVTWPQDTGFRAVATEGDLIYLRLNPVVSVEVLPGFSLGCGVMVDYGEIGLEQGLRATPEPFANNFRFSGNGWSVGYNVGLLWQPHEKISFGVTFRSSTTLTFSGDTEFEQQPVLQPTDLPAHATFDFPLTVVCGLSFRPTTNWNIEFNADYTDWSSFKTVTIYQESPAPFPVQQDIPVTFNWQPSWMYEFGVTRNFEKGWRASAGYLFNQNSVPDANYSPLAADMNRHFFSIGVGRKGKRFDFDVTYQFGYGQNHTVTGSEPPSRPAAFVGQTADGTYDFISHAVLMTVGMRF
ncbi:MAG: outer membrane protein transport protein [Verrucomicrobiota bacterium]